MSGNQFKSFWNGIATIVFFAGIFFGFRPLGYSAISVAIFMWIIGGVLSNALFNDGKRKSKSRRKSEYALGTREDCPSCGTRLEPNSNFCIECGSNISTEHSKSLQKIK